MSRGWPAGRLSRPHTQGAPAEKEAAPRSHAERARGRGREGDGEGELNIEIEIRWPPDVCEPDKTRAAQQKTNPGKGAAAIYCCCCCRRCCGDHALAAPRTSAAPAARGDTNGSFYTSIRGPRLSPSHTRALGHTYARPRRQRHNELHPGWPADARLSSAASYLPTSPTYVSQVHEPGEKGSAGVTLLDSAGEESIILIERRLPDYFRLFRLLLSSFSPRRARV